MSYKRSTTPTPEDVQDFRLRCQAKAELERFAHIEKAVQNRIKSGLGLHPRQFNPPNIRSQIEESKRMLMERSMKAEAERSQNLSKSQQMLMNMTQTRQRAQSARLEYQNGLFEEKRVERLQYEQFQRERDYQQKLFQELQQEKLRNVNNKMFQTKAMKYQQEQDLLRVVAQGKELDSQYASEINFKSKQYQQSISLSLSKLSQVQ